MAQVVIDANLAIALAVNLAYSELAKEQITFWQEQKTEMVVPLLWEYEVVTALRKATTAQLLAPGEATRALEDLFRLRVRAVQTSLDVHRQALTWAARLNQRAAYDAQYLALAEQLGSEFWTADQRLANNARQNGATWVHWIGEKEPTKREQA